MALQYVRSLLDPFDSTLNQPKLFDGASKTSSGIKFRSSGNITLDPTGADNYVVLFPCYSQGVSWRTASATDYTYATPYPSHMSSTDRINIRQIRLVSSGLKLALMNNSDDNEGYWEAIRIPFEAFELGDTVAPVVEDGVVHLVSSRTFPNLSNYPTFQTGLLKELDRFLFKLNSTSSEHPYSLLTKPDAVVQSMTGTFTMLTPPELYDINYDVIVIRLVGRIDAVTPSVIRYQHVSNQEIIYRQDTTMARLATPNVMLGSMPELLDKTQFTLPAVQIS
jgi:hypothetical protein